MILTKCAACAAPLAHDAPRCVRCWTRYCDSKCQHDHWRRGHKQICKKIHRGGNAEQYHADKKYKEAVAVAVEACADDTKGQKCYICLEAVHSRTGEGLVRGCACGDREGVASGTTGVAHVSCLAEQAKILVEEAAENNMRGDAFHARWKRWDTCSICEQEYHGVVRCALGWACWKTYVGLPPETDKRPTCAMRLLGNGLFDANRDEEGMSVRQSELATWRRVSSEEHMALVAEGNLAIAYLSNGQADRARWMLHNVYHKSLKLSGEENERTLTNAINFASSLLYLKLFKRARPLLKRSLLVARRVRGESDGITLKLRWNYAKAFFEDEDATLDDLREAVKMLEGTERTARRVLGDVHPTTFGIGSDLEKSRAALRARESWWPFTVCAFAIIFLAWMCWKFGWGAMVFTFAVINFAPYVIPE